MAFAMETNNTPVVGAYVRRLNDMAVAESEAQAEKQREADEREAEIRRTSELASRLSSAHIGINEFNEDLDACSSSKHPGHRQDVAEIDGRPTRNSPHQPVNHNHFDPPQIPAQSYLMSSSNVTSSRIQVLESQIKSQNERIQELEAARHDLARQVADLQTRRDEAELGLADATIASTEDKKRHEEIVTALRQQIIGLIEERRRSERELEELRESGVELRKELAEEREKVRSLGVETNVREQIGETAASTVATTSERSKSDLVVNSEKKRHKHGRSHSNGSLINVALEINWGEKDRKKTKKTSHK